MGASFFMNRMGWFARYFVSLAAGANAMAPAAAVERAVVPAACPGR